MASNKLSKAQYQVLLERVMNRQPGQNNPKPFMGGGGMGGPPMGGPPPPNPMAGAMQPGLNSASAPPDPRTEMVPPQGIAGPQFGPSAMGDKIAEMEFGQVGQLDDLGEKLWLGIYQSSPEIQALGEPAAAYNRVTQMLVEGGSTGDQDIDEFVRATSEANGKQILPGGAGMVDELDAEAWGNFMQDAPGGV